MFRAIVWKELLDLGRDKRTLFSIALLPMLLLPLLGVLTTLLQQEQPVGIGIVIEDDSSYISYFVNRLEKWLEAYSSAYKQPVIIKQFKDRNEALASTEIDYVIIIPSGFSKNLTSLDKIAFLYSSKRVDTAKSQIAESIVISSINGLSKEYSKNRVNMLSEKAGITIDPDTILNPIRRKVETHVVGGKRVSPEVEIKYYTVRFLAFAIFFVVTPTVTYVSDAIMGEKERKTIEALLATPVKRNSLLGGKLIASSLIGFLAGIADIVGVMIYFAILQYSFGRTIFSLDYGLVFFHSLDVFVTVFATSALITPFIVRAGSTRAANLTSMAVIGLALPLFFSVLFVDIDRLPSQILYPLLSVPYTNSILMLYYYVQGNILRVLLHFGILVGITLLLYVIAFLTFNTEKILMPPSTGRDLGVRKKRAGKKTLW